LKLLFAENKQNVVAMTELEERVTATTIQTISEANSSTIVDSW
jgi:hypothetical protein